MNTKNKAEVAWDAVEAVHVATRSLLARGAVPKAREAAKAASDAAWDAAQIVQNSF
jgi:hypothetical protein